MTVNIFILLFYNQNS